MTHAVEFAPQHFPLPPRAEGSGVGPARANAAANPVLPRPAEADEQDPERWDGLA